MRRRLRSRWQSTRGTIRRRVKSRFASLLQVAAGIGRLFGWVYVVVLVPALLVVGYLVVREALGGGDVLRSLHMFALAMIWPLAAVALRSEGALALGFPLNVLVLAASVAFVLTGWAVLIRVVQHVVRWRSAR
jgi:hypothetical protein